MHARLPVVVLSLLVLLVAGVPASASRTTDRWYIIEMGGTRAGWSHESTTITEPGEDAPGDTVVMTSRNEVRMTMGRGDMPIEVVQVSSVTKRKDGSRTLVASREVSAESMTTTYEISPDGAVTTTVSSGGRESTTQGTLPEGEWIYEDQVGDLITSKLEANAERFSYKMLDTSDGLSVREIRVEALGQGDVEVMGKIVPATRLRTSMTTGPITMEMDVWVDENGDTVVSDLDMGFMSMRTVLADKELALSEVDPPELLISTMVTPSRPIESPRGTTRATYLLKGEPGSLAGVSSHGVQTAEHVDESTVRVVIDTTTPMPARVDGLDPYTSASANLDAADPEIVRLAASALEGAPDAPLERAKILRSFVYETIDQKDLGVGFATASEVARTRKGDCTEHAVLLAALLRADPDGPIPSRTVSGLIYADRFAGNRSVFAYHMWTQALVEIDGEQRWIDLDATLPGQSFDATHIALSTSSMRDGELLNSMAGLLPVLGSLEIEVVQTR